MSRHIVLRLFSACGPLLHGCQSDGLNFLDPKAAIARLNNIT